MSYDISFKVKVEGLNRYVEVGNCNANITWNVRDIIRKSTGLAWRNEENNGFCKDVIPDIEKGLFELRRNGEEYKKYEPENGWGTVAGTIRFFRKIIDAWDSIVAEDEALAQIATFWIE